MAYEKHGHEFKAVSQALKKSKFYLISYSCSCFILI